MRVKGDVDVEHGGLFYSAAEGRLGVDVAVAAQRNLSLVLVLEIFDDVFRDACLDAFSFKPPHNSIEHFPRNFGVAQNN